MQLQLPQIVETKGIRVLTTKQIAEEYEASVRKIKQNFTNNRKRFIDGKHYISLTGDDLKAFKNQVEKIDLVDSRASHLYLWTEKGALLHAKSLNTDKAWEVYDYLVDFYFRAKEGEKAPAVKKPKAPVQSGFDIAPAFRECLMLLPIEALDALEESLRQGASKGAKSATLSVLAEKMKRQIG